MWEGVNHRMDADETQIKRKEGWRMWEGVRAHRRTQMNTVKEKEFGADVGRGFTTDGTRMNTD